MKNAECSVCLLFQNIYFCFVYFKQRASLMWQSVWKIYSGKGEINGFDIFIVHSIHPVFIFLTIAMKVDKDTFEDCSEQCLFYCLFLSGENALCILKNTFFRDSLFSLNPFQSYLLPPNPVIHVLSYPASSVCSIVFCGGGILMLCVASWSRGLHTET